MSEPAWTLLAVIIGGVLTTGGAVVVDLLKAQRDQHHAAKELLREDLYVLLDDMKHAVDSEWTLILREDIAKYTRPELREFDRALTQIVIQSVKIGDKSLQQDIGTWIQGMREMVYDRQDDIEKHSRVFARVIARIYELLHMNTQIEHLVEKSPRSALTHLRRWREKRADDTT